MCADLWAANDLSNQHVTASSRISNRNITSLSKILAWPVRLARSEAWIESIPANRSNGGLCSSMPCEKGVLANVIRTILLQQTINPVAVALKAETTVLQAFIV